MTDMREPRFIVIGIQDGPAAVAIRAAAGLRWRDQILPAVKQIATDAKEWAALKQGATVKPRAPYWREIGVWPLFDTVEDTPERCEAQWEGWKARNYKRAPGGPVAFPLYEINAGGNLRIDAL